MTLYKPKVYTASKAHYHLLWKKMAEDPEWSFVEFTASWPNSPEILKELAGEPVDPDMLREGWMTNISEVIDSDFLLVYVKPSDPIKGTIFEAGVATGRSIPVLLVGDIDPRHSWRWHPNIRRFDSLREARDYLYRFITMAPPKRK